MGHEGVISLSILGWPGDFCSPFSSRWPAKVKTLSYEIYQPTTGRKDAI
jgi:hypothetical protein